jgi:glycosyltransferase involved in cell wall biosynthesis
MKISVCVTTLNEEESVGTLLEALLNQSKKPDEIVIVDGASSDKTVLAIRHYQKKDSRIKLLVEKSSRARGRNLGVEIAKNQVIAMTDAGCVPKNDWLERLSVPFRNDQVDVVAGHYKMTGDEPIRRAMSVFLGVQPEKFNINFIPSTRSVAFTKKIWEGVGGFPENLESAAEDTVFSFKLVKNEAKIARVKNAMVEWGMPKTVNEFKFKVYEYARGDAKSKIWVFPGKGFASHNIKSLSVLLRYLLGLVLLVYSMVMPPLSAFLVIGLLIYLVWAFRKVYLIFRDMRIAVWGPVLQIVSDTAVIKGFVVGVFAR